MIKTTAILFLTFAFSTVFGEGETQNKTSNEPPPSSYSRSDYFPSPGIRAQKEGNWLGSDHLYNVPSGIGILTEIVSPGKYDGPSVSEEDLNNRVLEIFKKHHLNGEVEFKEGKPPLPFFHLILFIYPVSEGAVLYCGARLFEEVTLDRVETPKGSILQAITWEKQSMILAPKDDIKGQISKCTDEVVNSFVQRYEFFEKIKNKS